jgi:competence protein ComEC
MPSRLYKILLFLGIAAAIVSIPAFWFSYPLLNDFLNPGQAAAELEVDFLDVGQGDAELIKTPFGQNILIDGGPNSSIIDRLSEELPFWERTIDLVILSHPHDDHVNGLNEVLKRYEVKQIAASGVLHTSPGYLEWLAAVKDGRIPLTIIDRPQTISLGENCQLRFLHPVKPLLGRGVENLNNSSLVVKLVYGETSFLFTGDIEAEVEKELLAFASSTAGSAGIKADLKADVLKVSHHGSDTSSDEKFLAAVRPALAVISVGADNTFGHPNLRVLKRLERVGAAVYRTDIDGTVKFKSDGQSILIIDH